MECNPVLTRPSGCADERRLTTLFRELSAADRATLLAFADFLTRRAPTEPDETVAREPQPLARPANESVVGAIKRLSHTYDMLDHGLLLNETTALMSAHVLQGRAAAEVIDELEALFDRHYQTYRDGCDPQPPSLSP